MTLTGSGARSNIAPPVTISAARTPAGLLITCDDCGPDWVRYARSPETIARALAEAFLASSAVRAARRAMPAPAGSAYKSARYTDSQQYNPADWTYLHAGDAKRRHPTTHKPVDCLEGSWLSPGGTVHGPTSRRVPAAAKRAWEAQQRQAAS